MQVATTISAMHQNAFKKGSKLRSDSLMTYSRRKVAAARTANDQKVTESVTLRFDTCILERSRKEQMTSKFH